VVIGCAGGGSNFAGLAFPFAYDKIHGAKMKILAVEPAACPKITKGPFVYDHGDVACMTPLLPMHSLGHGFIPKPIHAGGLRYHGMAPLVSQGVLEGLFEAKAYPQLKCYEAAMTWARTEGVVCAPETSHAVAAAIDEAVACRESGEEKVILFNYSGHGLMDLAGYDAYMSGRLSDYVLPDAEIAENLAKLAGMPQAAIRRSGKW
jgi:tryptophan synthase beta chain